MKSQVKIGPRQDKCACGAVKIKCSKRCYECFLREKSKDAKQRRRCQCGRFKCNIFSSECKVCRAKRASRTTDDGKVICENCGPLPPNSFAKSKTWCRKCENLNKKQRRFLNLLHQLGVPKDQISKITRKTVIRCAICKKVTTKPHVDHNHKTNKFRGLLCSNCNTGIGLLQDNANICTKAANYLRTEGNL